MDMWNSRWGTVCIREHMSIYLVMIPMEDLSIIMIVKSMMLMHIAEICARTVRLEMDLQTMHIISIHIILLAINHS